MIRYASIPGNIGDEARIKQVVDMAKEKQIPIRIGVNSGSLEKELVEKYDGVTPQGLGGKRDEACTYSGEIRFL